MQIRPQLHAPNATILLLSASNSLPSIGRNLFTRFAKMHILRSPMKRKLVVWNVQHRLSSCVDEGTRYNPQKSFTCFAACLPSMMPAIHNDTAMKYSNSMHHLQAILPPLSSRPVSRYGPLGSSWTICRGGEAACRCRRPSFCQEGNLRFEQSAERCSQAMLRAICNTADLLELYEVHA